MQNRSFNNQPVSSSNSASTQPVSSSVASIKPNHKAASRKDNLTRTFNTALVSTQPSTQRNFSSELADLTESAPFKAILNAVKQLAYVQGISEKLAAEEIIRTFRKMDEVWSEYIFLEGLEKLRGPRC